MSEIIIDSAELAASGMTTFSALSFYSESAMSKMSDITFYMANSRLSEFSGSYSMVNIDSSFTTVVEHISVNTNEPGWQTVYFANHFTWDGHSNVILAAHRREGSYAYPYTTFRATTYPASEGHRAILYYNDAFNPDPATVDLTTLTATTSNIRTDVKLLYCVPVCHEPVLAVTDVTPESFTISVEADGDSIEMAYTTATLWDNEAAATAIEATHTLEGLTPATQYLVGVRQVCAEGLVSDWTIDTVVTLELNCSVPTGVSVSDVDFTSAKVSWTATGDETSWEVRVYNTTFDTLITATATQLTVGNLAAGTTYQVAVRTICGVTGAYRGEWSEAESFTTSKCEPVSGVRVSEVTATTAQVSWTASDNGSGEWEIEYGIKDFAQGNGTLLTVSTNPATITGLEPELEYEVYVRTVCAEGRTSTWSDAAALTTLEGIETAMTGRVSLFPNPASSTVTVSLADAQEATVSVIDLNGREVLRATTTDSRATLDVRTLAQGAYFVKVTGAAVNTISKLIVK